MTSAVTVGPGTSVRHAARRMSASSMSSGSRWWIAMAGCWASSAGPTCWPCSAAPDDAIRQAILRDVITDRFFIDPAALTVAVQDGVVTLAGPPELNLVRHGIAEQVRHMEGVVAVRDRTEPDND